MTKVAAVIDATSIEETERRAKAALRGGADLAELRLDAIAQLGSEDLPRLAHAIGPRAIATLRSSAQGGLGEPEAPARHVLLQEMCRLGFRYVDVEMETDAEDIDGYIKAASRHHQDILVSHHFDRPVEVPDVADALEACVGLGDVGKVVAPVADVEHATEFVELARNQGLQSRRFVLIGMGQEGMLTRVLAETVGQEIQYAIGTHAVAPGQLSLETATRLKGTPPIVLGIVGHPLGHSISPEIFEAALAEARLPAVYLPFDADAHGIDVLLHAPDRLRLRGFSVTSPHKGAIADVLDELSGDAESLGAVNTVVFDDGRSKGHNTDVFGFRMSLKELGLRLDGRTALVLGAGGAAKATVHVLLGEGATVDVTNRTAARADALVDAFEGPVDVIERQDLASSGPWDLLVNATSVGTKGIDTSPPVTEDIIRRAKFVYDVVYNPPETGLLQAARSLGIPGASGLSMLLHQAAKSFELWMGRPAAFETMRRAAQEVLG